MVRQRPPDWPGDAPGQSFQGRLSGLPAAIYCRVSSNPDKSETKSVDDQRREGVAWAAQAGVKIDPADIYTDDDFSASRYVLKEREAYGRLRDAVRTGRYRVVWFWSTSRQTRGDIPLAELADEYEAAGTLWCFSGSLYNPANGDDRTIAEFQHTMDGRDSREISKNVRRGVAGAAYAGRPTGRKVYGYRKVYDPAELDRRGRQKYLRDDFDYTPPPGHPVEDSPAWIVREIFARLAAKEPISRIARDLEDRHIPTPHKPRREDRSPWMWRPKTVRYIAQNPYYVGRRVFRSRSWRPADRQAAVIALPDGVERTWEPLVTEEQWEAVAYILADPARLLWRPGKGTSLLAGVVRCGECGSPLHVHNDRRAGIVPYYLCSHRVHVGIRTDWLDDYVSHRVLEWLVSDKVYAHVMGRRDEDNATAAAARADIERMSRELAEAEAMSRDASVTAKEAKRWMERAAALDTRLDEARRLAAPAAVSPLLGKFVGPDAMARWEWALANDLPAVKQLIRAVADIRVHRGARGGDHYHAQIDPGRISWQWRIGPGEREREFGTPLPRARDRAAEALRADPWQADRALARKLGLTGRTVQAARAALEEAGEIPAIRRRGRAAPHEGAFKTSRQRAAEVLRGDPSRANRAVAAELGIAEATVQKVRAGLEAAGTIPVIRRRKVIRAAPEAATTKTSRQPAGR